MIELLKDLIGFSVSLDLVSITMRWAAVLPIVVGQMWLVSRTIKSFRRVQNG